MAQRDSNLMGQYAGIVTRGAALLIDILIVIVSVLVATASITLPLNFFLGLDTQSCMAGGSSSHLLRNWPGLAGILCAVINWLTVVVALFTGPIYFIFLAAAGGQTVGKYVMGVRIVRIDGSAMNYARSVLRWFGYVASLLPLGLGFLWPVIDDRRRAFHDLIAGTCVVYAWRAQQDEYVLARVRRFFGKGLRRSRVAMMRRLATENFELVTIATPGFNELNNVLRIVKAGIQDGDFEVLGLEEYAKSTDGMLNRLDVDPTMDDATSLVDFSQYAGVTAARIHQIKDDIPNDHFALIVLVNEQEADALVKAVARRTPAHIRRYELRDFRSAKTGNSADSHKIAPIPAADVPPTAADLAPQPPVDWSATAGAHHDGATLTPALSGENSATALAMVNEALADLQRQQAALEQKLAAQSQAVIQPESPIQNSSASLTSALPPLLSTPAPISEVPQNLTVIKGIGPIFEQRLYGAGVRTYVALAAATPDQLAAIIQAQKPSQPDYASWIAQAQRLTSQVNGEAGAQNQPAAPG